MVETGLPKLRIDKWLWYARVVKTRTLAGKLVQAGHVRVNKDKILSVSHKIKIDDVLTIALTNRIRVLKVLAFGERRGSAKEAAILFEDLSPPPVQKDVKDIMAPMPAPEKRPDKRARRQIKALKDDFNQS